MDKPTIEEMIEDTELTYESALGRAEHYRSVTPDPQWHGYWAHRTEVAAAHLFLLKALGTDPDKTRAFVGEMVAEHRVAHDG